MSDWGLPDWRNEEGYSPRDRLNDYRDGETLKAWYRWQFLRRDKAYRSDWSQYAEIHGVVVFSDPNRDPPSVFEGQSIFIRPPERTLHGIALQDELWRKYKTERLYNPAHETPYHLPRYPLQGGTILGKDEKGDFVAVSRPVVVNGFTWTFDLDRPIRPQLREAEEQFRTAQVYKHGREIGYQSPLKDRKKNTFADWRRYLRTLDAVESGASDTEILNVLLPGWRETSKANDAKDGPYQKVRHWRGRGEELKKSFPF